MFGYRSELDKLGLTAPPEYVVEGDFFHESGFEAMKSLLELPEPPDAVACASDSMAVGAMTAIAEAGLSVPDDIAVTGFDDADFAAIVVPALTTMRQDSSAWAPRPPKRSCACSRSGQLPTGGRDPDRARRA